MYTPMGMIWWFGKLMQSHNHVGRAFTIICYFWSPQKHQKCINHGPHKTFLMEVGEILRNGSDDIHIWRVYLKYVQLQYLKQKAASDIIVLSWKLSQYGHFFCCGVLRKKLTDVSNFLSTTHVDVSISLYIYQPNLDTATIQHRSENWNDVQSIWVKE